MPEANVLYLVTTLVVVGLVVWVAVVLKTAREPWARRDVAPALQAAGAAGATPPEPEPEPEPEPVDQSKIETKDETKVAPKDEKPEGEGSS